MPKKDAIVLSGDGKAYFFEGGQYFKYDLNSFQIDPGYPKPIEGNWPGLWESDIDAATNWGASGEAYFFKGSEYIGYEIATDKADAAKPIEGNWSGVWGSDIDAALDWGNGKLYFFKGGEYVKYDINEDKAEDGYPRPIEGNWPGLWSDGIDAAVNWGNGKAYFFRGDEYVSYDVEADAVDSGYPKQIDGDWPPSSAASGQLNAKRQSMVDLIDKWMPTSVLQPRVPPNETQDLMARAGWTKAMGAEYKRQKDAGGLVTTSCGDILSTMLTLWQSNFVGAFNIRDEVYVGQKPNRKKMPGAKARGFYVEAKKVDVRTQGPKPGDILVFQNGVGPATAGTVAHVGILYKITPESWFTAAGGGGQLPDQTATVSEQTVEWVNNVPVLKSPTDTKKKQLDGWIDLDRLEQTG